MNEYKNGEEPKLTYAVELSSNKLVHIDEVKSGLDCNYICPECFRPLIARKGEIRQHHFAHHIENKNCTGGVPAAIHWLAEVILEEEKAVMVPAYKGIEAHKLLFSDVEIEKCSERKDLRPDVVGITDDGRRWFIEIRNTHEVDKKKIDKLIESNISCVEINVSKQDLDKTKLKNFLLNSIDNRDWINNPAYEQQIANEFRKKISMVETLLLRKQDLHLPSFRQYKEKNIMLNDVSKIYMSENGLCSIIKAQASDGLLYYFKIGNKETLESQTVSLNYELDYNELNIYVDTIDISKELHSFPLNWSYHHKFEKEQKEKISKYKENPKYEIKTTSFCYSSCKYNPINGKCIYKSDIVCSNGIEYIICNKQAKVRDEMTISKTNNQSNSFWNPIDATINPNSIRTDRYYDKLQKTKAFEFGNQKEPVLECDIIDDGQCILVLHQSNYYPIVYKISIVYFIKGWRQYRLLKQFPNYQLAKDFYNEKLNLSIPWEPINDNMLSDEDLPF